MLLKNPGNSSGPKSAKIFAVHIQHRREVLAGYFHHLLIRRIVRDNVQNLIFNLMRVQATPPPCHTNRNRV